MSTMAVAGRVAEVSPRVKARIAGLLYLTNSFAHFVSPPVGARVFPFLAVSGIAEVSFCLWLLVVGVNVQRWKEQAGRSI